MSKTTVELEKQVRDDLKEWKELHGLNSMSAAVAALLLGAHGGAGGDDDDGDEGNMNIGSDDDGEEERIPQLFSYRLLAKEAKALKYHTGLRPGAQDWLMAALREAVRQTRVFVVFRVSCFGLGLGMWLGVHLSLIVVPFNRTTGR